jgi:hypothetical protein
MLIQDEASLHLEEPGAVLTWRYNGRLSREKIEQQTLLEAKLVMDDYQEPVLALRNRQGDHYKVTDLLPACLPLNEPLSLISSLFTKSYVLIELSFEGQRRTLQILRDCPFATRFEWALDQGLLQTVSLREGKNEFEIDPGDFTQFKISGAAVLTDLYEDGNCYHGWLRQIVDAHSEQSYSLPCLLPKQQLWARCIDYLSLPAQVSLPVMVQWSPKQQCYEVIGIEPLMAVGEQRLELVALKTRAEFKPLLLVQSPLPSCHGLIFSCQAWVNFIEFEPSPQRPLMVKVEVSEGDAKSQLKAKTFESDTQAPFWADVSLVEAPLTPLTPLTSLTSLKGDHPSAQEQEVRIDVVAPGKAKLVLEQRLKVPHMYHLALDSSQHKHVPLVLSTKACGFEYGSDETGTRLEGSFKVRLGDDSQALYLQRLEKGKSISDLYYRVDLEEWLRFGIAGLREGFILECIIQSQQRTLGSKSLSYWQLQEIKSDLTSKVMLRQARNAQLKALWSWSCFETSPYAKALPEFYRHGAIVVAQADSEVALALFLSPGLLRKAGYSTLNEAIVVK